jgi:hypothetical protein
MCEGAWPLLLFAEPAQFLKQRDIVALTIFLWGSFFDIPGFADGAADGVAASPMLGAASGIIAAITAAAKKRRRDIRMPTPYLT